MAMSSNLSLGLMRPILPSISSPQPSIQNYVGQTVTLQDGTSLLVNFQKGELLSNDEKNWFNVKLIK